MTRQELPFFANNGVTRDMWREGDVVHKILQPTASRDGQWVPGQESADWNFWRREALAYETDLPGRLGLAGPRLLSSTEEDGGIHLELAAVEGRTGTALTTQDLVDAAFALGRSQGSADLPAEEWLSTGLLRGYVDNRQVDGALTASDEAWAQELIAGAVPDDDRALLVEFWDRREELIALVESLPRTVAHGDAFPLNLFATEDGPLLVDWAWSGDAAVGEDVGNLVVDCFFDEFQPLDTLDELAEAAPAAYLAGLAAAGWQGAAADALAGIRASAVRYVWLTPLLLAIAGGQAAAGVSPELRRLYAARFAGLRLCAQWGLAALRARAL